MSEPGIGQSELLLPAAPCETFEVGAVKLLPHKTHIAVIFALIRRARISCGNPLQHTLPCALLHRTDSVLYYPYKCFIWAHEFCEGA